MGKCCWSSQRIKPFPWVEKFTRGVPPEMLHCLHFSIGFHTNFHKILLVLSLLSLTGLFSFFFFFHKGITRSRNCLALELGMTQPHGAISVFGVSGLSKKPGFFSQVQSLVLCAFQNSNPLGYCCQKQEQEGWGWTGTWWEGSTWSRQGCISQKHILPFTFFS